MSALGSKLIIWEIGKNWEKNNRVEFGFAVLIAFFLERGFFPQKASYET